MKRRAIAGGMELTITELWIYPVKSLRGIRVDMARMETWGLENDRRFMVVDEKGRFISQREVARMSLVGVALKESGLLLTAPPQFPEEAVQVSFAAAAFGPLVPVTVWGDGLDATAAWPEADAALSRWLGVSCRLVYMANPEAARPVDPDFADTGDSVSFADGFPLLLTNEASLQAVRGFPNCENVEMNRFRPNIVVAGEYAWDEDHWLVLEAGGTTLRVVKPCARCVITTIDQASGERSPINEPLRALAKFHRDKRGRIIFGQNVIPDGTGTLRVGSSVKVIAGNAAA